MENKTKKQINEEWKELCDYVKIEILGYKDKKFPKYLALRLKGLSQGKHIANNNIENTAKYEFCDILLAFKINKYKIINSMKSVTFKDESHMINFIMRIVEDDINNIVMMIERKKKSEEKVEVIETVSEVTDNKAKYTKKTKEIKNNILNDLW